MIFAFLILKSNCPDISGISGNLLDQVTINHLKCYDKNVVTQLTNVQISVFEPKNLALALDIKIDSIQQMNTYHLVLPPKKKINQYLIAYKNLEMKNNNPIKKIKLQISHLKFQYSANAPLLELNKFFFNWMNGKMDFQGSGKMIFRNQPELIHLNFMKGQLNLKFNQHTASLEQLLISASDSSSLDFHLPNFSFLNIETQPFFKEN